MNSKWEAAIWIFWFTHWARLSWESCVLKFSLQNLSNFHWIERKTAVQAGKLLWSLPTKPQRMSKVKFLIHHLPVAVDGGKNKIPWFLRFFVRSVNLWNFRLRQGRLSFYGVCKGIWGSWHRSNLKLLLAWYMFWSPHYLNYCVVS